MSFAIKAPGESYFHVELAKAGRSWCWTVRNHAGFSMRQSGARLTERAAKRSIRAAMRFMARNSDLGPNSIAEALAEAKAWGRE